MHTFGPLESILEILNYQKKAHIYTLRNALTSKKKPRLEVNLVINKDLSH